MSESAIAFHNIAELDNSSAYPGTFLRRWPRVVSESMLNGQAAACDLTLSEIRFVVEDGVNAAVALTSLEGADLFVYYGDYLFTHQRLRAGCLTRLLLERPRHVDAMGGPQRRFASGVWRVCLDGQIVLHGVESFGNILRPPRPDEEPSLRWLAYGSSITHGYTAVARTQCYAAQAADRLGVDVLNLGLSGSCHAEAVVADYIASRGDWDFATFELGVNMRDHVDPDAFDERIRHFVGVVRERTSDKPLVLITPFTTAADVVPTADKVATFHTQSYRKLLAAIASDYENRNVHLIDGRDLLPEYSGLTCDLVHPSTEGHTRMAAELATRLEPIIRSIGRSG